MRVSGCGDGIDPSLGPATGPQGDIMDQRKPSSDKRRAIEGILGSKQRRGDVELPDDYRSTGLGSTADPPAPQSGKKLNSALMIATVIILIGLFAAFLIVAKDSIFGVFGIGSDDTFVSAGVGAGAGPVRESGDFIERENYERLEGYNRELETTLEEERATSAKLREDVDKLTVEIERLRTAQAGAGPAEDQLQQISDLEARLKSAQDTVSKLESNNETVKAQMRRQDTADQLRIKRLEQDNEQLEGKIDELQRDVAASRSELNVLRSTADESQSSSEQLEQVNGEYRRVLTRLREAHAAGRKKDERIEELLEENGVLRQRVSSIEEQAAATERDDSRVASAEPVATDANGISKPVPLSTVRPEYPRSAVMRKVSGTVKVRVLVSESGRVLKAEVISSPDPMGALDRAALTAVRAWTFDPARRNGRPIQMYYIVPLIFKL